MAAALWRGHRHHFRGGALGIRSEAAGGPEDEPDDGGPRAIQDGHYP